MCCVVDVTCPPPTLFLGLRHLHWVFVKPTHEKKCCFPWCWCCDRHDHGAEHHNSHPPSSVLVPMKAGFEVPPSRLSSSKKPNGIKNLLMLEKSLRSQRAKIRERLLKLKWTAPWEYLNTAIYIYRIYRCTNTKPTLSEDVYPDSISLEPRYGPPQQWHLHIGQYEHLVQ